MIKKSKYNSKKIFELGRTWDSEMELNFYKYLLTLYKEEDIVIQPKYTLQEAFVNAVGKKVLPILYKADFEIITTGEVYDCKGFETTDFKLKKKMFEFKYKKELKCVTKAPKYTGLEWISTDELNVIRKNRKKGV